MILLAFLYLVAGFLAGVIATTAFGVALIAIAPSATLTFAIGFLRRAHFRGATFEEVIADLQVVQRRIGKMRGGS